jgi:hypothetical protein
MEMVLLHQFAVRFWHIHMRFLLLAQQNKAMFICIVGERKAEKV